ncbi:MAG TPA: amino acid adenylation domain-containing protein, partial [Longimicrobium sp.]|nr:amino acid adenylation domain-containing protein [Longimicrobium sp.]
AERLGQTRVEPVSFAQEGLWFLNRLQPDSPFYNINLGVRLHGALDVAVLERAFAEIVRRHEPLRTTFAERDGTPVQVIAPFSGFSLAVQELSGGDEEGRAAEVERQVSAWVKRPFNLASGPLFRAVLLRLGAEEHVLVLSMHHTVSDGWSMGVLFGELSALYEAYREGRESPLAEPRMRFADFAVQQRALLQGATLERELAYWRERLAGAPALLELPTDRARPAVQSNRGARERMEIPAGVVERLRALAQREGATLYMVLLAAFQVLLSKYSGSEDVVVGSPVSGRTRSEMEALIGYFINTLVLRTDLSGDPGFRALLGRVREVALGAYDHQELPFETLVAELHPERSLSHSPVFQVLFSLHTAAEGAGPRLAGVRTESAYTDSETAKFDLNMVFDEDGQGLQAALGYSTDLFDEGTIRRMLAQLGRVLEQVAAEPDVRLSELRLLGDAERQQVLVEWNATEAEFPRELCTHHLVEAQVERTPDAVAVVAEEGTLTFAELNARANRLAHHLAGLGVGPDVRVGICMERSLELAVGLLAVVKAGGCYVPLDPDYPADRLRHMVEDAAPAALLTHGVPDALVAGLMEDSAIPVIRFETDAEAWAGQPDTNPVTDVRPGHLVYVIYTSGSTGRPKGVMNHHACLVNRLAWGARAWDLAADDVLLCKTSLSFDGHIRELFLPWSVGARVVMARPGGHKDPDYLLQVMHDGGATMVNLNGSLLMVLLEHPRLELMAGLRQMLVGGESFSGTGLTRFLERVPGTRLHHLYGPSEAATAMMAPDLGPAQARRVVPIGRPTANSRMYLLDPAGNPVPVGVVGEMYVGGDSVGRGYLDRPALTAERFVPDPFAAEPGARLYRTGDLGRWLANGMIEFLGRNDFQVKIRGFRIELGEVEARLREHARVGEAAVMARPDATGENRLIAWYTSDEAVDPAGLRAHLAERLPDYMVPAAFVRMESFPLTPSVKLDRKALPDPQSDAFVTSVYEPPVGETEVALAEIWADVLGVERVGRRDHFFELGGHSLRAVQVVSRVRQVLEAEVPLGEIFLKPVLADFARALEQAARSELPMIAPVERGNELPLSFAQQRLWFVEQMGETGTAYHVPKWLRLAGRLDGEALRRALDRIVARHEALRTSFAMVAGEPVQRIIPAEESAFPLREDDLVGHPDAPAEVRRIMDEEAETLFDLVRGPLIRGRLVRLAEDDQLLLVSMHHIVSDGWSMGVLLHELGTLYTAFLRGSGDPLPPLEIQYADYAVWQRRWMEGDALQRQADYWKATLTGAPDRLEVPLDRPRPAQQDFAGGTVGIELDEELTAALKALSRRHGTTLFMTLLAGWAAVLSRLSGQGEVVVGTPAANRGRREIEGLIGFFINTLALRLDLSGGATVPEVLARVKARVLGAQQHQDIPFEQVVDLVQPTRTLAHSPLFQAIFVWQNTPRTALELPELTVGPVDWQPQLPAKYDLSLALSESGGRIRGGVVYAAALFERETVERWTGYLENALRAMVAGEGRRVADLPLIPEAESRQVLEEWNRTESAYPRDVCIHELFEAQVRERPDAVALVWGEESLTYRELDARANRLANLLIGEGVGLDARVGVLLERSAELVVSILAVLKAGG